MRGLYGTRLKFQRTQGLQPGQNAGQQQYREQEKRAPEQTQPGAFSRLGLLRVDGYRDVLVKIFQNGGVVQCSAVPLGIEGQTISSGMKT